MNLQKYGSRNWAVYDENGQLICVTVYKKGAIEVIKRLNNACHDLIGLNLYQEANSNNKKIKEMI